jgi:acylphosphatase
LSPFGERFFAFKKKIWNCRRNLGNRITVQGEGYRVQGVGQECRANKCADKLKMSGIQYYRSLGIREVITLFEASEVPRLYAPCAMRFAKML